MAGLVGAALAANVAVAQAQPALPRVGVLDWEPSTSNRMAAFDSALRELGYVDGQNVSLEYHYAEGSVDRADAIATDFARRSVNLIVAFSTPAVVAAKKATVSIPIIITSADPIETGLVTSLVRPGGNITGVSNMMPDLEPKRFGLLRELIPGLQRVAFLGSTRDPAAQSFIGVGRKVAASANLQFSATLVSEPDEIEAALVRLVQDKVEAVIVQPILALNTASAARLAQLSAQHKIPVITNFSYFARAGGLMSYGPNPDFSRRAAARFVDKVLKGAKPGDLPIEQPTKFELLVNLETAKALGITVPTSILLLADEVIE